MACDISVIGVQVADVEEMLEGVKGCSVCPRDPEIIGKQLSQTLNTPHCEGRKAIIERGLDLESVAQRIVAQYEQALSNSNIHDSQPTYDAKSSAKGEH